MVLDDNVARIVRIIEHTMIEHGQPGSSDTQVRACGVPGSPRRAIGAPSTTTQTLAPSETN
jgi:hypothetical protein